MIAASYIGQLVGAILFSRLAETYGRVPCAAFATALMSVLSLVCALAGNFQWLFICRLVQGVGVGKGVDLYDLNPQLADPGQAQPAYAVERGPVRNGFVANLVTQLLGLGPVEGSLFATEPVRLCRTC